jgi:glycine/D-amino acid oxidase-like deaminating enzyme
LVHVLCLQVTVLEAAAAPAQGATKASWAWLNSNYKQPQHYKGDTHMMQLVLPINGLALVCFPPGSTALITKQ